METQELICVNCPKGCRVKVEFDDNHEIVNLSGNSCPRGKAYAIQECTRPMRILTTTVKINNAPYRVIPVITSGDIPLDLMSQAMEEIRKIEVEAPIKANDVVVENFLDTGVDLLASRSMIAK